MPKYELHPSPWAATRAAMASRTPTDEELLMQLGQPPQSGEAPGMNSAPPLQAMGSLGSAGPTAPAGPPAIITPPSAHTFPGMGPHGAPRSILPPVPRPTPPPTTLDQFTGRPQDRKFEIDQKTSQLLKQAMALKSVFNTYDSPEDQKKRYDMAMETPGIQDQKAGISRMEDMISMQAANMPKAQADLSGPLSRLYDSLRGGSLADPHPQPNVAQASMEKLRSYFEKMQDDKRDLAKNIQGAVNGQKSGQNMVQQSQGNDLTSAMVLKLMQDKEPKAGSGTPVDEKLFKDFQNSRAYQAYQKNQGHYDEMQALRSQVALANPSDDAIIPIIRASIAAHGHPNMTEVQMDAGSQAVIEKLINAISKATSGKMSEQNRQLILQSMDNLIAQQANVMGRQHGVVTRIAKRYHQEPSAVADLIGTPPKYTPPSAGGTAPAGRTKALEDMSQEELDAYEKSLKGGK
jgi:hypothetical protein